MDKLAAGIIDKLSIVGFFNVIISGSVLLYGISPILDRYAPDIFYLKLGLEKDIEKAIVACAKYPGILLQVAQVKHREPLPGHHRQ